MTKLITLALVAAVGCMPPATGDTATAKKAIDAANANWARLTSSGHADSLAEFYAQNAVIMPPNMAPTRGKAGIRAFFATLNPVKPTLSLRADSVWANGAAAVEQGRWWWKWAGTPPAGMPGADSGKYVVRWVNENGRWLIAQDIWNSDVALPTPAAPPAAPARRTTRTRTRR